MPDDVSPPLIGLTEAEAAARLRRDGANELPRGGRRHLLRIVLDVAREPMFALLLGAGVVYLMLGDLGEAAMLLAFATVSVVITIVQETRSERVIESLRDLTSPRALVIRDGVRRRIPGREVVCGDLVAIAEGDRVPADAVLLSAHELEIDESLLTGEAVPVRKTAGALPAAAPRPGGDDLAYIFSGTLVVRGRGIAEIRATGPFSEIGKIGRALGTIETEPPLLRRQTRRLVAILAIGASALSLLVVLLYGVLRGSWLQGVLGGIALGMSMLPEEFPLVLTVFTVMGAWRISRAQVLTRRAAAIETLGAATVLCTDKTGTLTKNRMSVAEMQAVGGSPRPITPGDLPSELRRLAETASLASAADAVDPMDAAIRGLADRLAASDRRREPLPAHAYGLRPDLLAVAQAWPSRDGYIVAAKGAPEAIAGLCRLAPAELAAIRQAADAMAARGRRVLAVACASFAGPDWPSTLRGFDFAYLGLVGLADPLRPSVPDAVVQCRAAGIRVAMVTGDYPATARAIAAEAGLEPGDLVAGVEIDAMDDAELARRARGATVFARIMPEQKLRIVEALKADGEVVAMTGDGVNDAPALKAAHIGIAMGGRGTDVAREAAAIVLLDDDFGSIVEAIRLGRRIYDNLRKAMGYILAVHVPIAGLSVLPLLFGWPLVFLPVHIAFLEMVIDPVCSIVFEAETEEADVMARPPRDPQSPLFSGAIVGWSLFQGGFVLALVGAVYGLALAADMPEREVRALAFVSLVFANVGLIFANRSFRTSLVAALRRPNPALWWALGATTLLLAVMLAWPPAAALFRFGPLHAGDLALCGGAGLVTLGVLDLGKNIWRARLTS